VAGSVASGRAMDTFRRWVTANGGDPAVLDDFSRLPGAAHRVELLAEASGFIQAMDSRPLGILAMEMGGGRASKDDVLDLGVGIDVHCHVGQQVTKGQKLLTLHHNGKVGNPLPPDWITIAQTPCAPRPWLLETVS